MRGTLRALDVLPRIGVDVDEYSDILLSWSLVENHVHRSNMTDINEACRRKWSKAFNSLSLSKGYS